MLLRAFLLLIPGIVFVDLLERRRRAGLQRWCDAAALGCPLGLGVVSLADFGLRMWADRCLGVGDLVVLWVMLLAAAWGFHRVRPPEDEPQETPYDQAVSRLTGVVLGLYMAFALHTMVAVMTSAPGGFADGAVIWAMAAKTLAVAEGSLAGVLDQLRLGVHSEYPHFVSGSASFVLRGGDVDALWPMRLVTGISWLVLVFGVRRVLAASTSDGFANVGALLVAGMPCAVQLAGDLYADPWLAALNVLCVGTLAMRAPDGRADLRWLVLGGFVLGLLGWTKQEGLVLATVITACAVVWLAWRGKGRRRVLDPLMVLLPSLAGHAASWFLRMHWTRRDDRATAPHEHWEHFTSSERWGNVGEGVWNELHAQGQLLIFNVPEGLNGAYQRWGFYWPALAALLILVIVARRRALAGAAGFIVAVFLLQVAAYGTVFATVAFEQEWHIRTALARLLLQVAPLGVVGALWALGCRGESGRGGGSVAPERERTSDGTSERAV